MPNEQLLPILWQEQFTFWWDNDDFLYSFEQDQHEESDLYSVSSL